jgi:hypothetical protein
MPKAMTQMSRVDEHEAENRNGNEPIMTRPFNGQPKTEMPTDTKISNSNAQYRRDIDREEWSVCNENDNIITANE